MDTLIAVMLFLNVISPTGHYTAQQINDYAVMYAVQISLAETVPGQLPLILAEFESDAIVVIDDLHG